MEKDIVHVDASFEPLVPKFMANRRVDMGVMRDALERGDLEHVRALAHKIKGAGGSYGFDTISEMAGVIEQAAKATDAATIRQELGRLGAYLESIEVVYD